MHPQNVDLNLFVVFEAIYAEGGITRASWRLHLSQPAISHALGRLRDMFDDPPFTRHGHTMIPAPLARRMIEPVRQSLRGFELTLRKADRFEYTSAAKRFTVGMRNVLEAAILPNLIRRITASAPRIDITIVRAERRELEKELSTGTLDAAIDVLLSLPDEIRRQHLVHDGLSVVVRRRHPTVRTGIDLETYLSAEHVAVSSRCRGLTAEDFELGRHDLRRRIRLRCQDYFAACRVVSETDLVLTMPERYAPILNAHFRNRLFAFPLKVPAFDCYLYWHANADSDPANAWLRRELVRAFDSTNARRARLRS